MFIANFQVKAAPHFVLVQNGIENKMNYPSSDPVRLEVRANTEPFLPFNEPKRGYFDSILSDRQGPCTCQGEYPSWDYEVLSWR